jgi:signal peptidase I
VTTVKQSRKWLSRTAIGLAVVLFAALLFVRFVVGWFFVIPQNGMYPGFPAGTRVFGLKRPYADISQVARGDIIIFQRDQDGGHYVYIWRVIGLPGETVEAEGDKLRIDGRESRRKLLRKEGPLAIYRESLGSAAYDIALGPGLPPEIPARQSVLVPDGHLFVMGDNRQKAADSRIFGPIPFSSVIAKKW